jgi:hypothetical protein
VLCINAQQHQRRNTQESAKYVNTTSGTKKKRKNVAAFYTERKTNRNDPVLKKLATMWAG